MGIGLQKSELMSEVTRGQVDNRTIVKVNIQTCQITYKVEVYIYESESIAIRNGKISEYRSEHRKVMCTARETQECYVGNMGQEQEQE